MASEGGFREADEALIPDGAKSFLKALHRSIRAGGSKLPPGETAHPKSRSELSTLYEEFPKLTERYFKATSWPSADAMGQWIEGDESSLDTVMLLYKELYFRHISQKLTPTVDDQFDAFQTYVDLFDALLGLDTANPAWELPNTWVWDVVESFVSQFQAFHVFRNKVKDRSEYEINLLKEHEHMWSAQTVVQYLHALVKKAKIDMNKKASEQDEQAESGVSTMFRTLGMFSLVSLLRVNALLCDFPSALKCLEPLDLRRARPLVTSVLGCHLCLYYFMGLSYLMCRRYADALKVFGYFLSYLQRNRGVATRYAQGNGALHPGDFLPKRVEAMHGLVGIAYVLSGGTSNYERDGMSAQLLDEQLFYDMRDCLDEKLVRMSHASKSSSGGSATSGTGSSSAASALDTSAFEEVFSASVPRFLTVCPPDYDAGANVHNDALAVQLKVFLMEVRSRLGGGLNEVATYLQLFTTISIQQLANFLRVDEEVAQSMLLRLGHKSRQTRWVGGSPSEGVWHTVQENINAFHIDSNQNIQIRSTKNTRRWGDFFVRQTYRFEELTRDVRAIRAVPAAHPNRR